MRVVAEQAEHDQVGVEAVHAVPHIRVVTRLRLVQADVLHNLVFAFSRNLRTNGDQKSVSAAALPARKA